MVQTRCYNAGVKDLTIGQLAAAAGVPASTVRFYEREIRFYRELAPRIGGPLAQCHAALFEPQEGWFTLVLEDVAPAVQGDRGTTAQLAFDVSPPAESVPDP